MAKINPCNLYVVFCPEQPFSVGGPFYTKKREAETEAKKINDNLPLFSMPRPEQFLFVVVTVAEAIDRAIEANRKSASDSAAAWVRQGYYN